MHTVQTTLTLKKGSRDAQLHPSLPPARARLAEGVSTVPPKRPRVHGGDQTVPEVPLVVEGAQAPAFLRKLKNAAIGTGCDIRLKVAVTGCPVPTLAWYKNNHCLAQESGEYGALWIRDCKPTDAGVYTCIARNCVGESQSSAVLAVLELEDSEECGEEETFETQKVEASEGYPHHQHAAVQREPTEGELRNLTDTSRDSTPSSLRTALEQLAPSEHPSAGQSPAESQRALAGGGEVDEEERSASRAHGCPPWEVARQADTPQSPDAQIRHLGVEPLIRASRSNLAYSSWGSEDSLSVSSDVYGSMFSLYRGKALSIPADLCENTSGRSPLEHPIEPAPRLDTMAQNQGASRASGLPPTSLKTRPASPKASRVSLAQPITPLTPRRKLSMPSEYRDTVPAEFQDKAKKPKVAAGGNSPLPARRSSSGDASPAHSRSGSWASDRMRYLETFPERRRSFELADGQPWPGFRKWRSFDHTEQREGRLRPSLSEMLDSEGRGGLRAEGGAGAEAKRSLFRQKAASFDERGRYASRARDVELKISEELSRIKKTAMSSMVARPVLRSPVLERAVNRELSSRKAASSKWAPNPPGEVPRGLEGSRSDGSHKPLQWGVATARGHDQDPEPGKAEARDPAVNHLDQEHSGSPGQQSPSRPPGAPQPVVETVVKIRSAPEGRALVTAPALPSLPGWNAKSSLPLPKEAADWRRGRPELGDAAPRLGLAPLSPACMTPPRPPGTAPGEGMRSPEPDHIGADSTMDLKEDGAALAREKSGRKTARGKSKKSRPTSPELESSDDSYVSAGEDPLEPPVFEISITDSLVTVGASVLLKCIITGTPMPEVVWKKDGEVLKSSQTHMLKAEGERHTLYIPSATTLDGGLYSVSAANEVGLASCCASVQVRVDSTADRKSLPLPTELYSPITSDEEYLSPLEDPIDLTYKGKQALRLPESQPSVIETHFRAPPSFQVSLSDQVAVEGQNISLTVCVLGQPKPIIYWLRNREPVKSDSRHYVLEGQEGRFHLNIVAVQREDSGMYSCKAINEYGTKQCEGKLEVKVRREDQALTILAPCRDITVNAGESACLECEVRGPPDVDVDWLTNEKLVQPALLNCKMHFDGKRCKLLLKSVHEDDSGVYTCKLSTAKDEKTCSARLTVLPSVSPLFTRKLEDVFVIEGRTAHLDVKVSGTPPPTITWMHYGERVVETEEVRIVRDQGLHSLVILHAASDNEGEYAAIAQNPHGDAFCSADLYVEEPRPVVSLPMAKLEKMPSIPEEPEVPENETERFTMPDFIKPIQNVEVTEGKDAVLECQVTGLPYPAITWYHNGHRLDSTDERRMTQYKDIHRLVIRCADHSHAGVYKSVIANKVGKATSYAHIFVSDVIPDTPNGPAVVSAVTGRTVTLQWNKPKKLDPSIDPATLTYVIQSQVVGTHQWHVLKTNVRETSYTVQGLNKGSVYLFRVQSATSKSCSKPSPVSEPIKLLDRGPYLEEAPCFTDKPDEVFAVENQSSCITCTLNYVQAEVSWTRNGVELTNKPRIYELCMPDDDQHMLKIVKVGKADVGELMVTARNKHGEDSCRIALLLAEAPRFESIMEDMVVSPEETARLAVVVEGKPLPDILWFKDDDILVESNHLSFVYDDSECSLVILNTTESDSGVYTCTATNLAGEVSCKAELTILKGKTGNDEPMDDEDTILRKMRLLSDYYDVHQEIGRGAFSCVKRVTERSSKLDYAAKFISFRATPRDDAVRELEILSQLDHERIVFFHDAFEKKSSIVIVLELCTQEELFDHLVKKQCVLETELRLYIRQILEGVSYLHQNSILHLDIKPENILMADAASESIRICDFGNAQAVTPGTPQFCRFGTPEYVSPEIVNQEAVSNVTDIWPVGVIAYIGLTGISPFHGENDKSTLFNVRNYNVAFEENMFVSLSRESRGFVITLLVDSAQRPSADECLQHAWFSSIFTVKGKVINTEQLKILVSRRRWQCSLINYKSSMVMRSINELLEDTTGHTHIGIPKHLSENRLTSVLSSSSDSDDIEEFPFIPKPLQPELLSSRLPLHQLRHDHATASAAQNGLSLAAGEVPAGERRAALSPSPRKSKEELEQSQARRKENGEVKLDGTGKTRPKVPRKRSTDVEPPESSSDEDSEAQRKSGAPRRSLRKGVSIDTPDSLRAEAASRRGEFRRGSSADSALALLGAQEMGEGAGKNETGKQADVPGRLKKSMSMELPRRSPSPGRLDDLAAQRRKGAVPQEDYALKLELMRQRLLRGGSVDSKMSGLRGPLLEHLGIPDEPKQRSSSLERHSLRPPRPEKVSAQPRLARAVSSDTAPSEEPSEGHLLRKSASFSQGGESTVLHRPVGAPLEIPVPQLDSRGYAEPSFPLKESPSLSALTDPSKYDGSRPPTPVRSTISKDQRAATPEIKMAEELRLEVEGPCMKTMIGKTAVITHSNLSADTPAPSSSPASEPLQVDDLSSVTPTVPTTSRGEWSRPSLPAGGKLRASAPPAPPATGPLPVLEPPGIPTLSTKGAVDTATTPEGVAERPEDKAPVSPDSSQPLVTSQAPGDGVKALILVPQLDGAPVGQGEQNQISPNQEAIPPPMKVKSSSLGQFLNIENIESEEVFEAKFKKVKQQSSLTRSLKHLIRPKSEEKLGQPPHKGDNMYRPAERGAPIQVLKGQEALLSYREDKSRSRSEQNIPEAAKESSFVRKLSLRFKGTPGKEEKARDELPVSGRKHSWSFGRSSAKDRKPEEGADWERGKLELGSPQSESEPLRKEHKNSPALTMRRKIESTISGISLRFSHSHSEERVEGISSEPGAPALQEAKEGKRGPFLSLLRRSTSEAGSLKKLGIPQNQLATQTRPTPSSESLQSDTSVSKPERASAHGERRSQWERWGFLRMRRDKAISQPNISLAVASEEASMVYHRSASDFPPVFHVKLKDQVLLEDDSLTLCSLPAGSPTPTVIWSKDQHPLVPDDRIMIVSCPDGRQLVTVAKMSRDDTGVYECSATNPLGSASSSCTVSLARLPGRPGPPEIPQVYKNTALIIWKPAEALSPCTYTLEQKLSGEDSWKVLSAQITDCFFNATELPSGTLRFRVACVNKAGQGPYSQTSDRVVIEEERPVTEQHSPPAPTISSVPVYPTKVTPAHDPGPPTMTSPLTVTPTSSKFTPAPKTVTSARTATSAPTPSPTSIVTPAPTVTLAPKTVTSAVTVTPAPTPSPTSIVTPAPTVTLAPKTVTSAVTVTPAPTSTPTSTVTPAPTVTPVPKTVNPAPKTVTPAPMVTPTPTKFKSVTSSPVTPSVSLLAAATQPVSPARDVAPAPSISPVGSDSSLTPTRLSPNSRLADGSTMGLRQGVPQKPYTFMEEKARGRFGVVRECKENATGKIFMAKIIHYEGENKQTVLQEYEVLKALHHEKIMSLHEAYVTPRYLVLISENCLGKEILYSLIDRFRYSEDDVVSYILQILQGLEYLHGRRIVHLDIKPDNVIVTYLNIIKLVDFGSAQFFNATVPKPLGRRVGTPEYMCESYTEA
ncbi:striated muscle preferentially expressed protein kinase [Stegostoma tigrinum]|uniref:striated muscle preferentially expressed protein kinase n=1 Tax=Stegostoma tigrinum TaxID=3053191 RepID=UPI002870925D|nr:striated muscle preferentially expressed protein kinase [Stegostoma tigrinum]